MTRRKLDRIFAAVRAEPPPAPPEGFDLRVTRQIRREPLLLSFSDQLSALFPKLVYCTLLVMAACVAADYLLTSLHFPGVRDGVARISDQWLFTDTTL